MEDCDCNVRNPVPAKLLSYGPAALRSDKWMLLMLPTVDASPPLHQAQNELCTWRALVRQMLSTLTDWQATVGVHPSIASCNYKPWDSRSYVLRRYSLAYHLGYMGGVGVKRWGTRWCWSGSRTQNQHYLARDGWAGTI